MPSAGQEPHAAPSKFRHIIYWLLMAVLIVVFDQWSKQWIEANFFYGERLNVLPVFDLTLVYNEGAAWSFLSDAGGWQRWLLSAVSAIVSVVLVVWIMRTPAQQRVLLVSLTLILGGAVGNLIDRVLFGHVIDFLLVYYEDHHFPVFNIADSAITVGAIFMLIDAFSDFRSTAADGSAS